MATTYCKIPRVVFFWHSFTGALQILTFLSSHMKLSACLSVLLRRHIKQSETFGQDLGYRVVNEMRTNDCDVIHQRNVERKGRDSF
jgi:hypothetical protein